MTIKLSDYINDENRKLTPEQIRQFLIDYGFDEANEEYIKELERKAKAFDAIVDIEDDFIKYHGFSPCVEEYAEEVEEIISECMEDE